MEILKIIGLSIGSIIILFTLTKIMGQREMSQLSIFDYFITITIGSIAAEMSTSLENNFMQPVVAMIVYALITLIVSYLNTKFVKLRPILSGKTLILYDNWTLFKENFRNAKIDINEFLVQCRTSGFFNLSDIKTALLEENLKELKLDKIWLMEMLQKQGIVKTDNIFLATYNTDGNLSAYLTNNTKSN